MKTGIQSLADKECVQCKAKFPPDYFHQKRCKLCRSLGLPTRVCSACGATYKPCTGVQKRCRECVAGGVFRVVHCVDCGSTFRPRRHGETLCTYCMCDPSRRSRRISEATAKQRAGQRRRNLIVDRSAEKRRMSALKKRSAANASSVPGPVRMNSSTANPRGAITIEQLCERDGWVCGVCGGAISKSDLVRSRHAVQKEHIIAALGNRHGASTYDNLQPAHAACNASKGNRNTAIELSAFDLMQLLKAEKLSKCSKLIDDECRIAKYGTTDAGCRNCSYGIVVWLLRTRNYEGKAIGQAVRMTINLNVCKLCGWMFNGGRSDVCRDCELSTANIRPPRPDCIDTPL